MEISTTWEFSLLLNVWCIDRDALHHGANGSLLDGEIPRAWLA